MLGGCLEREFTNLGRVLKNVLELMSCRYQKGYKTNVCVCWKDNLLGYRCLQMLLVKTLNVLKAAGPLFTNTF